jgi:hypothetical protein
MGAEKRWILTYDKPDLHGLPTVQTCEFNLADELPTLASLPNIKENTEALNAAQEQQEAIVEQKREAADYERLYGFPPNARHRPGTYADGNTIAVVKDGLKQHTFRMVDNANVDFTQTGQPYDMTTGRPLMTRQQADEAIKKLRGRRSNP